MNKLLVEELPPYLYSKVQEHTIQYHYITTLYQPLRRDSFRRSSSSSESLEWCRFLSRLTTKPSFIKMNRLCILWRVAYISFKEMCTMYINKTTADALKNCQILTFSPILIFLYNIANLQYWDLQNWGKEFCFKYGQKKLEDLKFLTGIVNPIPPTV